MHSDNNTISPVEDTRLESRLMNRHSLQKCNWQHLDTRVSVLSDTRPDPLFYLLHNHSHAIDWLESMLVWRQQRNMRGPARKRIMTCANEMKSLLARFSKINFSLLHFIVTVYHFNSKSLAIHWLMDTIWFPTPSTSYRFLTLQGMHAILEWNQVHKACESIKSEAIHSVTKISLFENFR